MSTFDELRKLYTIWAGSHSKYQSDSMQLVLGLANGFCRHIGAPKTYQDFDGSSKEYVFPLEAFRDTEGKIHLNKPEHMIDVLTRDEDGYWIAGIAVALDRAENSYQKTIVQFYIRFILRDHMCELHIGDESDGKFEFDVDKADSGKPAYEYMVSLLRKLLSLQPWSTWKKAPIGFEPPRIQEP